MSQIQIRIDQQIKDAANKELKKLGLDMSSAVKIYLHQIIIHKGIPFPVVTENGLTPKKELQIIKASEEAKRGINLTEEMTSKEAIEYLDNLK